MFVWEALRPGCSDRAVVVVLGFAAVEVHLALYCLNPPKCKEAAVSLFRLVPLVSRSWSCRLLGRREWVFLGETGILEMFSNNAVQTRHLDCNVCRCVNTGGV